MRNGGPQDQMLGATLPKALRPCWSSATRISDERCFHERPYVRPDCDQRQSATSLGGPAVIYWRGSPLSPSITGVKCLLPISLDWSMLTLTFTLFSAVVGARASLAQPEMVKSLSGTRASRYFRQQYPL